MIARRTTLGGAATELLGRTPLGASFEGPQAAAFVRAWQRRLETFLIPDAVQNVGRAGAQYRTTAGVYRTMTRTGASEEELAAQEERMVRDAQAFEQAQQQLNEYETALRDSKRGELSYQRRAEGLRQTLLGEIEEEVVLQRAQNAAIRTGTLAAAGGGAAGGGAAGGGAGAGELAGAGAAGAVAIAAAQKVAQDQPTMTMIRQGVTAGGPVPERPTAAPAAPAEMAPMTIGERASMMTTDALVMAAVGMGKVPGLVTGAKDAIKSAITGPAGPFLGLMATQMLGSTVGGDVGNYISTVGGSSAMGMMLAQMAGLGPRGMLAGAALGSVAGNIQRGGAGGEASAIGMGVGAVLGGALGALSFTPFGVAAGAAGGAWLGSTLAGAIFGGGGAQPTDPQLQQQMWNQAATRILTSGTPAQQRRLVGQQLQEAANQAQFGSGQSQQRGQAQLSTIVSSLVAQQTLEGPGGPSSALLSQAIRAALQLAPTNPVMSQQLLQQATAPLSAGIQSQFTYALSQATTPGAANAAAVAAQQRYQALLVSPTQGVVSQDAAAVASAQRGLAADRQRLADDRRRAAAAVAAVPGFERGGGFLNLPGLYGTQQGAAARAAEATVKGDEAAVRQQQSTLSWAQNLEKVVKAQQAAADQAEAAAALSQEQQQSSARANLMAAEAGGAPLAVLAAQRTGLEAALREARTTPGLSPAARLTAVDTARANLLQNTLQGFQAQYAAVQATTGLTAAQAIVPGDPVSGVRAQIAQTQSELAFVTAHAHYFDPSVITGLQTQLTSLGTQLVQSLGDQAVQLIQSGGQIAAAKDYGNALAQAQDIAHAAQQAVRRAVGPTQRKSLEAQALATENTVHDQVLARIQEVGTYTVSLHPNDAVAQAQANVNLARQELAMARGYDQVTKAQTDLNNANTTLNQAYENQYTAIGALRASSTADPVKQINDQVNAAYQVMVHAVGTDAKRKAKTDFNNLLLQRASISTQSSADLINFEFQMMEISSATAADTLTKLASNSRLSRATRNQLLEQARQYELGLVTPIGGDQLNLAPGNIRLPTFYDVMHGFGAGRRPTMQTRNAIHAQTQINVYVAHPNDVPKVAEAIGRATNSNLKARLHAAGVTH
jgi:hypothetical protein